MKNHFDVDAEIALVGSLIVQPLSVDATSTVVHGSHFSDYDLGRAFDAIVMMRDAQVDITDPRIIAQEFKRLGIKGSEIGQWIKQAGTGSNASYYAGIIRKHHDARQVLAVCDKLRDRIERPEAEPGDVAELGVLELSALKIDPSGGVQQSEVIADRVMSDLKASLSDRTHGGVFTGVQSLDELIGPLRRSEMMVIGARPGKGKTVLGWQAARYNAEQGRPTLFVSLEMKDAEIVTREICRAANIDSRQVRSGTISQQDVADMDDAAKQMAYPLHIYAPNAGANLPQIRAITRHAKLVHDIQLVVVDYLGVIEPTKDQRSLNDFQLISEHAKGCKRLAKELDVPLITLCQLSRDADKEIPTMRHLAGSASIEREADMIILIHHPMPEKGTYEGKVKEAQFLIAKHRHGQSGMVKLGWEPERTQFVDSVPVESMSNYNSGFGDYNNS